MQINGCRTSGASTIALRGARYVLVGLLVAGSSLATAASQLAFPGALGWAAATPGGRGGKIIRVTTLAADGPGSFVEAIQTKGPRIVVFEVGGVIDLQKRELKITEPF